MALCSTRRGAGENVLRSTAEKGTGEEKKRRKLFCQKHTNILSRERETFKAAAIANGCKYRFDVTMYELFIL